MLRCRPPNLVHLSPLAQVSCPPWSAPGPLDGGHSRELDRRNALTRLAVGHNFQRQTTTPRYLPTLGHALIDKSCVEAEKEALIYNDIAKALKTDRHMTS